MTDKQIMQNTESEKKINSSYVLQENEEYPSERFLSHCWNILDALELQIIAENSSAVNDIQANDEPTSDLLDRAEKEKMISNRLRENERKSKLLHKIRKAKERIQDKDYGFCEICGAEIGIRRLEIRPTATLCIDCKTFEEIREKQTDN